MLPQEAKLNPVSQGVVLRWWVVAVWLAALLVGGVSPQPLSAQQAARPAGGNQTTGWVCGAVVDESFSLVAEADLILLPAAQPGAPEPAPAAHGTTDAHGSFCFEDLPSGFYQLRVAKAPWPIQPLHPVEIRAGLLNRLTPIELELEPGEPRVSYEESFDGMPPAQGRAIMERLLLQGDSASIKELARRLLPKRGVRIDLGPLVLHLDTKPLMDHLMRELDSEYLPPLKTARYVYVVGELIDARSRDAAAQLLLRKLRDGRRLPAGPAAAFGEPGTSYVSDVAIYAFARLSNKDFGWKYGQPPLQNQPAVERARTWWENETARRKR